MEKYVFFRSHYKAICISHYPDDETAQAQAQSLSDELGEPVIVCRNLEVCEPVAALLAAAAKGGMSEKFTLGEVEKMLAVGQSWRLLYGEGNINNRVVHIRGIVDDRIVLRHWKHARWNYSLESIYFFYVGVNSGKLTLKKLVTPPPGGKDETR